MRGSTIFAHDLFLKKEDFVGLEFVSCLVCQGFICFVACFENNNGNELGDIHMELNCGENKSVFFFLYRLMLWENHEEALVSDSK